MKAVQLVSLRLFEYMLERFIRPFLFRPFDSTSHSPGSHRFRKHRFISFPGILVERLAQYRPIPIIRTEKVGRDKLCHAIGGHIRIFRDERLLLSPQHMHIEELSRPISYDLLTRREKKKRYGIRRLADIANRNHLVIPI